MLKTRVITALVLLAILLPVLYLRDMYAFGAVALAFFGASVWESYRLVQPNSRFPVLVPVVWTLAFAGPVLFGGVAFNSVWWWGLSTLAWLLVFMPMLKTGLPATESNAGRLHGMLYMLTLVACFMAITALYRASSVYLLSVMALVWIADIGAYAAGRTFGKRKLAPSISPGKSWEGAIGGALAVVLIASLTILYKDVPVLADTFAVHVQSALGWPVAIAILVLLVAASVVGDLAESQLKRRVGAKDSSNLLPGHGGVLDRIDALVPVLPLAALIDAWL